MQNEQELLDKLAEMVIKGDLNAVKETTEAALAAGIEPWKAISEGLNKGMKIVGEKFAAKEYYLPEVLLSATTMQESLNILLPMIEEGSRESKGKVILGTVEGDIHDLGKNIVKSLLIAGGYEVIDLGKDVPPEEFIKKAKEVGAQVIGMSTLMTPTLDAIQEVEEKLEDEQLKGKVKTIIGGGSVSEEFAEKVSSDAYGKDAVEAVTKVQLLIDTITAAVQEASKNN
jgi:corrinoid protein of di/trimethylamine methyltransferase